MVGKNEVWGMMFQLVEKARFGLNAFGKEGQPSLAQLMIDHHHVGGNILEHQNLNLFFHMNHLGKRILSPIPYFTRQGVWKWGEDRVFRGKTPECGAGNGPSSGGKAKEETLAWAEG